MTYRVLILLGTLLFRVLGLRIASRGLDVVPSRGGAVLAVSHFGYLDFALLQWAVWRRHRRLVRFLVMRKAFDHPVSGPLLRRMGHIPVDRGAGAGAARQAMRAAGAGELVGVFPEGRVSRSWTLLPLAPGAAGIALRARVPLIPVVVWGGHRVLTRGRRPSRRSAQGAGVLVVVGQPLAVGGDPWAGTAALTRRMRRMLDAAQDEMPGVDGAWWTPRHRGGSAPTPEQAWSEDLRAGIVVEPYEAGRPDATGTG